MKSKSTKKSPPAPDYTKCWFYKRGRCDVIPNKKLKCIPIDLCMCGVRIGQFFTPYKYALTLKEEEEYTDYMVKMIEEEGSCKCH